MLSSFLRSLATKLSRRREGAAALTAASAALASASASIRSLSASAAADTSSPPSSSAATAKGVNYLKSGSDPVIPATLPERISEVSSAPPTAFELRRALEQSGSGEKEGGEGKGKNITGSLGARGAKQLLKLEARARIKDRNSLKAKK